MRSLDIAGYTENCRYDSERIFLKHQCLIPGIFKRFLCHMRFLMMICTEIRRSSLFHACFILLRQYCGDDRVFASVLRLVFSRITLYRMIALPTLGHTPAPHTLRSLFERTAKSRVWPNCYLGGEADFNPITEKEHGLGTKVLNRLVRVFLTCSPAKCSFRHVSKDLKS